MDYEDNIMEDSVSVSSGSTFSDYDIRKLTADDIKFMKKQQSREDKNMKARRLRMIRDDRKRLLTARLLKAAELDLKFKRK